MTATIALDKAALDRVAADAVRSAEEARSRGQDAMAREFQRCTLANFGVSGKFRPSAWDGLAESTIAAYRRRKPPVTRTYATLVLEGDLRANVLVEPTSGPGPARVVASDARVPYSTAHQYGSGRLPARPYFPMDSGDEVMPEVADLVAEAAEREALKCFQ